MGISEKKMQIVINNYFKQECDVNTSIREAFEKGFRIGVKKGSSAQPEQKWIPVSERLPEYGIAVLTVNSDDDYEVNHIIDDESGEWFYDGVIAWMPLLEEPYKGGEIG